MKKAEPTFGASLVPVTVLLSGLLGIIFTKGASSVLDYAPIPIVVASIVALVISMITTRRHKKCFIAGLSKSIRQIGPSVPILLLIATVSASWMLSGLVPTMINYGLLAIKPSVFLPTACLVCVVVSTLTGSSWTTIATIGIAFLGIGQALGYNDGWIAGAIISGAYVGDKMSPLSDTTVIASSTCGVDVFTHVRYMTLTVLPTLSLTLLIFGIAGLFLPGNGEANSFELLNAIHANFNISPWLLLIPAITVGMILMRVNTVVTLITSTLLGVICAYLFQPQVISSLYEGGSSFLTPFKMIFTPTSLSTGNEMLDNLVSTGGVMGILPVIALIFSTITFGGVMMGTGMIAAITKKISSSLNSRGRAVGATVGTGIALNALTADQYLSIAINGSLYNKLYSRLNLQPRLLSRTIEDSTSVTSVIIPWSSCSLTQASVLGIPSLTFIPYCFFNILSPIVTLGVVWLTPRIKFKVLATSKN